MRWLTGFFLASCFVLQLPAAPQRLGNLAGTTRDEMGAVIFDARVLVYSDPNDSRAQASDLREVANFKVDSLGQYSIRLPLGVYDLLVTSSGFYPSCQKVQIGAGKKVDFSPRLKVFAYSTVTPD